MNIRPLSEDQLQLLAADSDGQGTKNQNNWSKNRYRAWALCHNAKIFITF